LSFSTHAAALRLVVPVARQVVDCHPAWMTRSSVLIVAAVRPRKRALLRSLAPGAVRRLAQLDSPCCDRKSACAASAMHRVLNLRVVDVFHHANHRKRQYERTDDLDRRESGRYDPPACRSKLASTAVSRCGISLDKSRQISGRNGFKCVVDSRGAVTA